MPALIAAGFLGGILVNIGSGGASSAQRLMLAVASGIGIGLFIAVISLALNVDMINAPITALSNSMWRSFIVGTLCTAGAVVTEFKM
ncbi:MAG: hypothetical protein WCC12_17055 [Anaerolineales bacterium]